MAPKLTGSGLVDCPLGGSQAFVTVGPHAWCDYITDGTDDYVQIAAAIASGASKIQLTGDTFNLGSTTITLSSSIELCGVGRGKTNPTAGLELPYSATAVGKIICYDIYAYNNGSFDTITDRTPMFLGHALDAIEKISSNEKGEIDHASLPEFAIMPYRDEKGEWWAGRSLGAMISILVKATQERSTQYAAAIADRDKKIAALEARLVALEKLAPAKA